MKNHPHTTDDIKLNLESRQFRGHRRRHHLKYIAREQKTKKIILVGAPNVGKSVIFSNLTGKYVDVSNYPGTSVEISSGFIYIGDELFQLIDSPGINGLVPRSEDEQVTLNLLSDPEVAGIIQVIDTKNFRRGLTMTHQLVEFELPMVVCLNIYDEALERGIIIDAAALQRIFGIEFVTAVATEGRGMNTLRKSLSRMKISHHKIKYHPLIEEAVSEISSRIESKSIGLRGAILNFIASEGKTPVKLFKNPPETDSFIQSTVRNLVKKLPCPPGFGIQTKLIKHIESYTDNFLKIEKKPRHHFKEKLGFLTMHPWYGIPFILVVLFILYELVGVFGAGVCVDFLENHIFGGIENGESFGLINPFFIRILGPLNHPGVGAFFYEMLVGQYGAITVGLTYSVAIVFPVVTLFFIFFGLLEDSGYLPRLTVMSNKLFQKIGLNGRAILPLVLGLGCDTMATFTTRILETKKERTIATLLLALGIPCSAQLGVILGMLSSISFLMLLIVVFTVILQLGIVGYAASKLLRGKPASLITEIPPFRVPKLKNILIKTYFRVKWFMIEAVPLFILGTFVLFVLAKFRLLEILEKISAPIISGILMLPKEATEAFIIGFLRRDYGAAGLFHLADKGILDIIQITVGITVMVLFVPCLANFFVIIKERGFKTAMIMSVFIVSYAVIVGGVLNQILRLFS